MTPPAFLPYVSFPGNAAEAFEHYQALFGGDLELSKYDDMPDLSGFPVAPPAGAVAHAVLSGGLISLAGGDSFVEPSEDTVTLDSDTYSFLISLPSAVDAEALIGDVVGGGGSVAMPFEVAPWGDHYGQVKDRFGVLWAIVVPGNREA